MMWRRLRFKFNLTFWHILVLNNTIMCNLCIVTVYQVSLSMSAKKRRWFLFFIAVCIAIMLHMVMLLMRNKLNEESREAMVLPRDYVLAQGTPRPKADNLRKSPQSLRTRANIVPYMGTKPLRPNTQITSLRTPAGPTPIVVYKPEIDTMISSYVKDYGTWEEDMLNQTEKFLRTRPGTVFLDVGCNIGVYSLFVAKTGSKVVSIDGVKDNLNMLSESAKLGELTEHITLLFHAISDTHKTVFMRIPPENIGGAHVDDVVPNTDGVGNLVRTITLDDLCPLLKGKSVFIKMDIEGSEVRAMSAAHEFFQTVDVLGVLMEWVHHRGQEGGQVIIDILVNNGLFPYADIDRSVFLNPDIYYTWPENVFWLKR